METSRVHCRRPAESGSTAGGQPPSCSLPRPCCALNVGGPPQGDALKSPRSATQRPPYCPFAAVTKHRLLGTAEGPVGLRPPGCATSRTGHSRGRVLMATALSSEVLHPHSQAPTPVPFTLKAWVPLCPNQLPNPAQAHKAVLWGGPRVAGRRAPPDLGLVRKWGLGARAAPHFQRQKPPPWGRVSEATGKPPPTHPQQELGQTPQEL